MKKAFTLAEILISMTIIGVISLLMIPVMQNTQLKSLETATAHFYSMMSQAVKQYMLDNDANTLYTTPMFRDNQAADYETEWERVHKETENFVYKYFNVNKTCTVDNGYDCFSKTIFNLSGKSGQLTYAWRSKNIYVLANGYVFIMVPPSAGEPAVIQVDINGKKGPNTVGRDIWYMSIYKDGVISENLHIYQLKNKGKINEEVIQQQKERLEYLFKDVCYDEMESTIWMYGAGCFARFEANGFKFDY